MAARNRRVERALRVPNRGAWIATIVVVLLGLVAVWIAFSPAETERRETVERLRFGDEAERVTALLGPPPLRCPGAPLEMLEGSFPADWPPATVEGVRGHIERETVETWVYPLGQPASATCAPGADDTVIGIARGDRVLWYVPLWGQSSVVASTNLAGDSVPVPADS